MKDNDQPHSANGTNKFEFIEADSESDVSNEEGTENIDIERSQWKINGSVSKCHKNVTQNMITNSKLNISSVQRNLSGTTTFTIPSTVNDGTNKLASLPNSQGDRINNNSINFTISKQTDNSFKIIKNANSISNSISSTSYDLSAASGSYEKRIEAYGTDKKRYCFKIDQTMPITKSFKGDSSDNTLVKNNESTKAVTTKMVPYATKNLTITKVPEKEKFSLDYVKPTVFAPSNDNSSRKLGPYSVRYPSNHKTHSAQHSNFNHSLKTSNNSDSLKTKETKNAKEMRTGHTETDTEPHEGSRNSFEHPLRTDSVNPVTPKMNGTLSILKPRVSVGKDHNILEDSNILYTNTNLIPDFIISSIQGGVENGDENSNRGSHSELKEIDSIIHDNEKSLVSDQITEMGKNQAYTTKLSTIKTQSNEHYKKTNMHLDDDKNSATEHYQSAFRIKRSDIAKNSSSIIDKKHAVLTTDSNLKSVYDVPKLSEQEAYIKKVSKVAPFNTNGVEKINKNADNSIKEILMVKPRTVAEKRRLLELARKKEFKIPETIPPKNTHVPVVKDKIVKKKVKRNRRIVKKPVQRRSYVLYKDRKIWVNTGKSKKCLANINSTKRDETVLHTQRKKFFLLNQGYKSGKKLLYRPGPLCKKQFLQISETHLWKTQMVKLPKITLEVVPQLGRRFCDTALHRLNSVIGGEMDDNKIEFALSALISKDENENIIPEPIRFPLTYEKKLEYTLVKKKRSVPQTETVNSNGKTRLSVDSESIASVIEDLIKYVEIKEIASSLIKEDDTQIHDTLDSHLELPTKNNCFEARARKRLSKVERELLRLSHKVVNVDDKDDDNDCNNAICDKPYCKLGCVCSSLNYNFSSGHCQELGCMFNCTCPKEASSMYDDLSFHSGTKVLSKNTVIRIEDEAKKNLAKVEREFTQTVIHTNDRTVLVGVGDRTKTRRAAKIPAKFSDFISSEDIENISTECFISLQELDLSDIIPFCLTHYEYSCRCKGFAIPKLDGEVNENSSSSIRHKPVRGKYKRVLQDTENVCNDDFRPTATKSLKDKPEIQAPIDKQLSVPDSKLLKHNVLKGKYIPKQNSTNLSQKRKKSIDASENNSIKSSKALDDSACVQAPKKPRTECGKPVFDGEIIIDSSNTELFKSLGGQEYARLIPWKSLINGFRNSTINIWYSTKRPSSLLINKIGTACPENCVNILSLSCEKTPIISWIKNNKLPSEYKEDSFSFLLKENKGSYEICGVSTKNMPLKKVSSNQLDEEETFYHKNIEGVKKSSLVTKMKYNQIHLIPENSTDCKLRISKMQVALPETFSKCKWQTVLLNSDFTFLSFNTISFSIRYTDLLIIAKYAKENKCTIYLRNDEMPKKYKHELFGIYSVQNFTDRIFIGPYLIHDVGNDVETLRYINKFLVSSESFNLMNGKEGFKSSYWLKEEPKIIKAPVAPRSSNICFESKQSLVNTNHGESSMNVATTIDLTLDDDDSVSKSNILQESAMGSSDSSQLMHENVEMEIINSSPKNPEDYDRYIVTNIPGFGYLGAFLHVNGKIDVSWPLEDKLLRFNQESSAISFLQRRFSSLLIRVPENFKIVFRLTSELDLDAYKPIDSSLLSGQFICGKFGCVHISNLDKDPHFLQSGIAKEVVIQLILKRNRKHVTNMYESLASTLHIRKEGNGYNEQNILDKALQEIQLLKRKEKQNIVTKNSLYLQKRELFIMMYKILSKLPPEQRDVENRIFRSILDKSETSPIEIIDSDDELQTPKTDEVLPTESTTDQILQPVSNPLVPIAIKKESKMQHLVEVDTFSQRTETRSTDAVPVGSTIRNSNDKLRIRADMVDTYDPVASVIVDLDDIPSDTDL